MTNGFDLNSLYNTIFNDLWEDAVTSTNSVLEQVFLYDAMQDDLEDQAVTMMTGCVLYDILPHHEQENTTETHPNNKPPKT